MPRISQGSVATLLRRGGIFNDKFIASLLLYLENRSAFAEVTGESIAAPAFLTQRSQQLVIAALCTAARS